MFLNSGIANPKSAMAFLSASWSLQQATGDRRLLPGYTHDTVETLLRPRNGSLRKFNSHMKPVEIIGCLISKDGLSGRARRGGSRCSQMGLGWSWQSKELQQCAHRVFLMEAWLRSKEALLSWLYSSLITGGQLSNTDTSTSRLPVGTLFLLK